MKSSTATGGAEALMHAILGSEQGSVLDMLQARAELHGDRPFLTWRSGSRVESWTYAQAWGEVERTAAGWRALGVGPGTRVAAFLWNSPQAVWAWFGAIGAGATYVLLNRHLRGPLLRDQLTRSAPEFVVTELEALEVLDEAWASGGVRYVFSDEHVPAGLIALNSLRSSRRADVDRLDPTTIGLITFTSGSTGRSKAVRLTHNSVIRGGCAYAAGLGLTEDDVIHGWNPLFHWGGMLFYALGAGAEYALYPRFSASRFWAQVAESKATFVEGFPVFLEYLLRQPVTADEYNHTLRRMLIGGYEKQSWTNAAERFGIELTNAFGASEAEAVLLPELGTALPPGSCGRPAPGWDVGILGDDGRLLQDAGSGELVLRPTVPHIVFRGYEGDWQATVEKWKDLWYHTGDWFERNGAGDYFFRGRMANRIRRRGENVSESELTALLKTHPAVASVAVLPVASENGEDDIKVAVVPTRADFDVAAYIAWCRANVPKYMMPRYFETWPVLPELQSGKIDLARLSKMTPATIDGDHQ